VAFDGGTEGCQHDRTGDRSVGGDRQGVSGVVVEPGEDLDVGAISEAVVGEIGLPGFVGLFGLEADVGGLRFLLWLSDDEIVAAHDPVCGGSREPDVMVLFEVPDGRVGAGIESGGSKLVADAQHKFDDVNRCGVGACARPA
jgi:hypothetical protein